MDCRSGRIGSSLQKGHQGSQQGSQASLSRAGVGERINNFSSRIVTPPEIGAGNGDGSDFCCE
jgi:hypothetical protein